MNFLKYQEVQDFLDDTGLTVKQGLQVVEKEISKLKGKKFRVAGNKGSQRF